MKAEVTRTGDDDHDRESWERRIAGKMAGLLIEATDKLGDAGGDADSPEEADGDER